MQPDVGVRQRHPLGQPVQVAEELDTSGRSETTLTSESNTLGASEPASKSWSILGAGRQLLSRLTHPFHHHDSEPPSMIWQQEYEKVKHRKIEDSPPYMPRLAALQDSNDSFCIFRRFGPAAARLLLNKEIELDDISKKFDALDHADDSDPNKRYRLKGIEHHESWDDEQQKLLKVLEEKLNVYYDLLLKYSDVRDLKPAGFRNHRSVYNYVVRNRPLYEKEAAFLHDVDDFVSMKRSSSNETHSRVEQWLESYIARRPRTWLHNFLKNSPEGRKSSNQLVHGFSKNRLAILAKVVVACLAMCTLFIPILLMFLADLTRTKMACVLAIFVFIFMILMSVLVDLTPHDFFIVVAAYSAVLVALLSNLTQGSASSASK
ncbi:uncharacterized protein LY89DRAFT_777167 [Mollisia scopiformis]|uniref:DUF6594 domain-containing protein n=1 Tax=Mollisia scopiformis TaxID=149040 RepID=A0A194XUM8_MOLSC|nr:uncharacterized protein LY89DRAFT_777167 [Mollisia scopiformis]KUJ23412.1 hypothetical protein LY89DRAFT_777167 [Mollisia scopiformis]